MVKVVEGEASHALNTSEVRAAALHFQTQCVDSGVVHMLYACEGVYHVTLLIHLFVLHLSFVLRSHASRISRASRVSHTPPPVINASPACRTSTTVLSTIPSRSSSARTRKVSCT